MKFAVPNRGVDGLKTKLVMNGVYLKAITNWSGVSHHFHSLIYNFRGVVVTTARAADPE
jgi:hypothetical protein